MAHIEDDKIVILDKKYIQIPERKSKSKLSPLIQSMIMLAASFPVDMHGFKKPKERPRVNLIDEYELIKLKKSKLSRNNRDWVEYEFNKHFIEVK